MKRVAPVAAIGLLLLALVPGVAGAAASVCLDVPPPGPSAIVAHPGAVTFGTSGPDVICGTSGPDRIAGLGGNDVVLGLGGDDHLSGAGGDDALCGGGGPGPAIRGGGQRRPVG